MTHCTETRQGGPFHKIGYIDIEMPSILSWNVSRGLLKVKQISLLGGTTFPEEVKIFVCFLETCVPKLYVSAA